jgi:alpha-N-arabinofuranosidase
MGHRSAEDYGKFALEAAKLMKWTDPKVKLIAAGSSNYNPNADWTGWNRTVLEHLKHHADYLSLHLYVGNRDNNFGEFMASSVELDSRIKTAGGIIDAALSGEPASRRIYIAWDEWNVWYRARGGEKERGRRILEEHYNLEDALVVATFLNTFLNHSDIVKIANMAQLVNVIAPIFTSDRAMYLQTIYYPLQLIASNCRGKSLGLSMEGPKYPTKRFGDVPFLDSSASYENGNLIVNMVNRHPDQKIEADIEIQDKQFGGPVEVWEVNGPDIKAENDFDSTKVKAIPQQAVRPEGRHLTYAFPAHSYTMLKAKLA